MNFGSKKTEYAIFGYGNLVTSEIVTRQTGDKKFCNKEILGQGKLVTKKNCNTDLDTRETVTEELSQGKILNKENWIQG